MAFRPNPQIVSLMIGYGVAGLFWGAFAAATPDLQAISGLGTGGFGFLLLSMVAGAFPAMLLLGRIMHRIQIWAMPGCLALFAASALVLGQADDATSLAVGLLLTGAASGALDVALNMRISTIEGDTGTRLFNRTHALFPLALLAASPLTGIARDAGAGPAEIFPVLAFLLAGAALIELRAGRDQSRAVEEVQPVPIRLNTILICVAAIAALGAFMEMATQNWAVIYIETVIGASATTASLSAAAYTLGLSVGRLAAHQIEARLEDARVVQMAAMLGISAFLVIAAIGSLPITLLAFLAAGIAVGPIEPTMYRIVAGRYGQAERGRALSAVTAVAYLGYLISPPILGSIAEGAGWAVMWATAAMVSGAVILLATKLMRLEARAPAVARAS